MRSKQSNKKRQQKRANWTVEPVRPTEREELIEEFVAFLDTTRRRFLALERSIR